ncbi:MAG: hypothetical protein ACM3KL_01180 [Alphaproteobacteria bacterium]
MEYWGDVLTRITPLAQYSVIPVPILAEVWEPVPRVYGWLGLCGGYALVMLFTPVRQALNDGLHCLRRYQRIWITFAVLGFGYFVFQFITFTPIRTWADLELSQITSLPQWSWPRLSEIWQETLLPALEGVAGIFDNATTTYPLSVIAAVLLIVNWRGLHSALVRALRKRYGFWGFLAYLILLLSAIASLLKPVVFWRLPEWSGLFPAAGLLRISATVDAAAFIFEYLLGVYIQVYLITVCLAWIKGVSFEEGELFRFAMRRFSYVLEWAGIVVAVSTLIVRLPLVLAYFTNIPGVLDYLPIARILMSGLILAFCSVQISLTLHNETLIEAMRAHMHFVRKNAVRLAWFLIICGVHFYGLILCDGILRGAISDRLGALFLWKFVFACLRGMVTGWLLASWVCLFRQCETGRIHQEKWIQY